jgi:hypothetical protein
MTVDLHSKLSWCETRAANLYHLRWLTPAGRKLNGGADTLALCGAKALWDVDYSVDEETIRATPEYGRPCPLCVIEIDRIVGPNGAAHGR